MCFFSNLNFLPEPPSPTFKSVSHRDSIYSNIAFYSSLLPFLLSFFALIAFFLSFLEIKRNGVNTVAFPGWRRAVFKHMAQVASTAGTDYLNPVHKIAGVLFELYPVTGNYIIETWPAGPGLEFGVRGKELLPAGCTGVNSFFLVIVQVAGKGLFRTFLPQDVILFRREYLFPFFFRFFNHFLCQLQTPFAYKLVVP